MLHLLMFSLITVCALQRPWELQFREKVKQAVLKLIWPSVSELTIFIIPVLLFGVEERLFFRGHGIPWVRTGGFTYIGLFLWTGMSQSTFWAVPYSIAKIDKKAWGVMRNKGVLLSILMLIIKTPFKPLWRYGTTFHSFISKPLNPSIRGCGPGVYPGTVDARWGAHAGHTHSLTP